MKKLIVVIFFLVLIAGILLRRNIFQDETPSAVQNFEPSRYLGKWYEIARFDHSFERGLERITAEYSLLENGEIKVLNRGWSIQEKKYREAHATAVFAGDKTVGHLKVTFFWPFSADYKVIALGSDYEWAVVGSSSFSYLWILARKPTLNDETKDSILTILREMQYDPKDLIWVNHEKEGS